jgi:hypothetical protein
MDFAEVTSLMSKLATRKGIAVRSSPPRGLAQ